MSTDIDNTTWQSIVEDNYREIYDYAARFLGNRHDAEDAVQETFLRAYRTWSGPVEDIRKWLFRIVRNLCVDKRRRFKRWITSLRHVSSSQPEADSPEDSSFLIVRHLNLLPERQREVFILRHWHGFSTEETARLLGLTSGTVKSHLFRAVEQLKESLAGATTESDTESLYKMNERSLK